jgi:hypothetical protein
MARISVCRAERWCTVPACSIVERLLSKMVWPMIGYACDETGYTDGSDWRVTDSGIHNKFHADKEVKGFDYGGQVTFAIPVGKRTDLHLMGTYTKYCWYGGIGLGVKM